jgi:hypothetical protein
MLSVCRPHVHPLMAHQPQPWHHWMQQQGQQQRLQRQEQQAPMQAALVCLMLCHPQPSTLQPHHMHSTCQACLSSCQARIASTMAQISTATLAEHQQSLSVQPAVQVVVGAQCCTVSQSPKLRTGCQALGTHAPALDMAFRGPVPQMLRWLAATARSAQWWHHLPCRLLLRPRPSPVKAPPGYHLAMRMLEEHPTWQHHHWEVRALLLQLLPVFIQLWALHHPSRHLSVEFHPPLTHQHLMRSRPGALPLLLRPVR